jgi:hypothetical protein
MSGYDGSGGNGIVGIEYSLGNAYELEGVFLCRVKSRRSNAVRGGDPCDDCDELGETPLIFDNNYINNQRMLPPHLVAASLV